MSDADRHHLRATFAESPELYDRARVVASREVFDDLAEVAGLEPGARLVEIGCGTGQATLPLAERGFGIVAIELGESLADLARRKLARFPKVKVVVSSFERWNPGGERFDAVVAFNSFHWIDPEAQFAKPARLLKPGGALAVVGMRLVAHDGADPVWTALQDEYQAIVGIPEPRTHASALRDRSDEFVAGGYFRNVVVRRYQWEVPYEADDYIAYLQTNSWHRTLDDGVRIRLFERIRSRILASPEQAIRPTMAVVLYVARRA